MTKRTFLAVLTAGLLSACTTGIFYNGVQELSVSFVQPSEWDGKVFPAVQMCNGIGGAGSTPALFVANIPPETNVIILEMNNLSNPALAVGGGLGAIGFYHDGEETATLLPVPGETGDLPSFAFEEKVSGKIPENVCVRLIKKYTAEQTELKEKISTLTQGLEEVAQVKTDVDEFIRRLKKYSDPSSLSSPLSRSSVQFFSRRWSRLNPASYYRAPSREYRIKRKSYLTEFPSVINPFRGNSAW